MRSSSFFGGLLLAVFSGSLFAACPAYLQGEYRKLHSTDDIDLCALTEGKPVLVINTASHCGFASQFEGLEALNKKYQERGLVVVGFASDDFNQESKDEAESAGICFINYGVTFTMLSPTHVRGDEANPLFKALAKETSQPKWNFNKYLVDKNGKIVKHFGSSTKPESKKLSEAIEQLL
jgi:glutathione peroxidase